MRGGVKYSAASSGETNLLAASAPAYVVPRPTLMQADQANLHCDMEQRLPIERIDALVVGGGQAGLAMSEHLSASGVPHLIVERHRIAERWRSERWDSLVMNGPAWHDRFPGLEFSDVDRSVSSNDFPHKETVADYFVAYAKKISAPI